ncbi:class A sortase [Streptococcus caprae]|uniref:Class A sortase n=1 Tax=Streptococcus caprae TaxID=1640501 RepID=A0ABV8CVI6_9STRE
MARKKQPRRWRRLLSNTFMVLLMLIGLALIFNKPIRNWIIGSNSNKYQITNVSKEKVEENKTVETTFDFDQVESLSLEAVLAAQMNKTDLPVIGGIAIPELNINLPIFKGMGNTELMYGAGTMKENQVMGQGNYALASHHVFGLSGSSAMLFSPLDNAKSGMKIYLTDKTKVYTYSITEVETVSPDHIEVIDDTPGATEITLVTCNDAEATGRIIVYGTYEGEVAFDQASDEIIAAFNTSYNQIN